MVLTPSAGYRLKPAVVFNDCPDIGGIEEVS